LDARFYLSFFNNLQSVAEHHYRPAVEEYRSSYDDWNVPGDLSEWAECVGEDVDRPRSLVVWGPSRTGKTEWARSLGNHVFFSGMFDLSVWRGDCDYVVFDDVSFTSMDFFKCWFGAQKEFSVTDKYMRKRRIMHGKPCVGCFNHDIRAMSWADIDWMEINCLFVNIVDKLF